VLDCYRISGIPPRPGCRATCATHHQALVYNGFWVWSDDPRDWKDDDAGR
jgi:hypothetical protein